MRRRPPLALWLAFASIALPAAGCDAVRSSNDPSRTPTLTRTATVPPPPTATPTPALPPNPRGLHRWTSLPIHYCIDGSQPGSVTIADFTSLVERAFATWGVPTVDDGACLRPNAAGDKVNEIGFGTPEKQPPPGSRVTEAGETMTTYSECTSGCEGEEPVRLVEADIVIEGTPPPEFRTRGCLYSTLLHETGHFLGLEHLPGNAVMAAETSDCPTALTPADRVALVARYGDRASPT